MRAHLLQPRTPERGGRPSGRRWPGAALRGALIGLPGGCRSCHSGEQCAASGRSCQSRAGSLPPPPPPSGARRCEHASPGAAAPPRSGRARGPEPGLGQGQRRRPPAATAPLPCPAPRCPDRASGGGSRAALHLPREPPRPARPGDRLGPAPARTRLQPQAFLFWGRTRPPPSLPRPPARPPARRALICC